MDTGAVPLTRVSGLTAAAHSFHAHDRARRGVSEAMTDTTAGTGAQIGGFAMRGLGDLGALLRRGDIALAIGVMAILVVLILPLPATLLDLALAISIILSVLILMTALFIHAPLEFSAFPTVLLIATMLRLALNLASTRLILARGHEGTAAAGHVIEAFGNFVMGGNFVIGIIVFTILVIVNFVVITKGSGRIAEVAARFHLDAMPGKQMAIDADLSAGLIDEAEARRRRKTLEDESRLLRRHGRRLQIRARRRHRRPAGGVHQHHRRHDHRHRPAGPAVLRGRAHLHAAHRRRRLGHADPGTDRLDRGGPAGRQGRGLGRRRQGAAQAALRLSQGARHVGGGDGGDGAASGHPDAAVPAAGRRRRRLRLHHRQAPEATSRRRGAEGRGRQGAARRGADLGALKMDDLKIELGYALLPLVNSPDGTTG